MLFVTVDSFLSDLQRESHNLTLEHMCRIQTEEQYIIPNPFANLSIKYHSQLYSMTVESIYLRPSNLNQVSDN